MCLMSVVLPAPLAPTNPNTTPRGTVRETLSRASLAPKRRFDPVIWMPVLARLRMEDSWFGFVIDGLITLAQQFDDLVQLDPQVPRLDQQRVHAFGQELDFFTAGKRRGTFRDIGARTVALGDNPGPFQFQIGARHRLGIDDQLLGQRAHGRNFLARREPPGGHQMFDLVDDLQVDRHAVVGCNVNPHNDWLANAPAVAAGPSCH